jgi:hypothetical protein
MLKFILGLLLGYYVSENKAIVKKYFNMFIEWCKSKKENNKEINE